ncbi:dual specificity phosphatase 28 [Gymnodraco acuticeps]|uniref:Dual specificity phosphatase 28 n=1 Tax=Gymnodraco acuticeps TaxID=8218 RepID=A0A6P8UA03_GYMAC|nr:dual specificity phosphatase 28 [Gymnodraco acuticeps]
MMQLCQVTRSLFISNCRSACSEELLQRENITFVINVSKKQPFPSDVHRWQTLRIPVYDDPNEDLLSHFDRSADSIQQEALRGGRSLVYCKNGRSRSATICIAYLMKHREMKLFEAKLKVKTARYEIDPNPGFLSQLQRYEQVLKMRRVQKERQKDRQKERQVERQTD